MTKHSFVPNPEQMALYPEVSGNDVNGLGETEKRRPHYVYWGNDPDDVAHGAVQRWFYTVDPGRPGYQTERARRADILNAALEPVAQVQKPIAAQAVSDFVSTGLSEGCFDKFGVTTLDPNWAFTGQKISFKYIVILGFHHDFEEISKAPEPEGGLEVMRQYRRAAFGAKYCANWLRSLGWDAEPLTGPMSGKLAMIPAAIQAGFGELGKHGSLITPEFGSSFRLSAVLTDCPLPLTQAQEHGIDDFCMNCRVCEDACPPAAIASEKQLVRGETKWYVDFDKCLPFFNEHQGCAICIAVCPWSRPGVGLNLAEKLERRRARKAQVEA